MLFASSHARPIKNFFNFTLDCSVFFSYFCVLIYFKIVNNMLISKKILTFLEFFGIIKLIYDCALNR